MRIVRRRYASPESPWLLRGILGLLALLVVVGIVSGGSYLYLRWAGSRGWKGPAGELRPGGVEPSLALGALADVADLEVVDNSLAQGQLETAYAVILFNTQLTDKEHVGNLLLLGQQYGTSGDRSRAQLCYQQASLICTLSPTLSDFARASSFLEIGGGMADWGDRGEAVANYDQAFALALHSPFIKDPHRADLFGELASAYEVVGERSRADECRALRTETLYSTEQPDSSEEAPPEQPVANFLTGIPVPDTEMVASYEERRVEAVRELIDFLQGPSGDKAIPEDLATEVTQSLVNEDNARSTAYEDELAAASSMVLRIGIAEANVDWLVIKYGVAVGAYGLQLVPAWSDDVPGVEAELSAARRRLHDVYGEQIATFGDEIAMDRAWFDVVRLEIIAGELGLYPDYPGEELIAQLTEVTESLAEAGDPSLHPEVRYEDGTPRFSLAWSE